MILKDNLMLKLSDKKHIIWDWNGTILNDVQHAINTMNILLRSNKLPILDSEKYKLIFQFPVKTYYDQLGFDYSKNSFENLCLEFVEKFMNNIESCRPFDEIENILKKISDSEQKITQSVLSATDQFNLDKMIKLFNFSDYFDFVYGIQDKFAKSKLYRGKELIEKSKISEEETILIGDTLHDLEVGRKLGIDVLLVTHGHQAETILAKETSNIVQNLW